MSNVKFTCTRLTTADQNLTQIITLDGQYFCIDSLWYHTRMLLFYKQLKTLCDSWSMYAG